MTRSTAFASIWLCRIVIAFLLSCAAASLLISVLFVASSLNNLESMLVWGLISVLVSAIGAPSAVLVWLVGRRDPLVVKGGVITTLLFVASPILYFIGTFVRVQ